MDRNIITVADVARQREAEFDNRQNIGREAVRPGDIQRDPAEGEPMGSGVKPASRTDKWFERLAKYIPAEAVALYLALAGLITKPDVEKAGMTLLGALLIISLVFNTLYLRFVWKIRRVIQIVVSDVALLVYAFATGGLIIQQLSFYEPRVGTALLIATTAFLGFFTPPKATRKS